MKRFCKRWIEEHSYQYPLGTSTKIEFKSISGFPSDSYRRASYRFCQTYRLRLYLSPANGANRNSFGVFIL